MAVATYEAVFIGLLFSNMNYNQIGRVGDRFVRVGLWKLTDWTQKITYGVPKKITEYHYIFYLAIE